MTSRLSGHFSIFGLVFFVLKSLLGILTLKPRIHVRIQFIYRTSAIGGGGKSLLLISSLASRRFPATVTPSQLHTNINLMLFIY